MNYASSYVLYISTVLLSTIFAHLAQVFQSSFGEGARPNRWFWGLSFFCLWFVVGFRYEVGFDYENYKVMYSFLGQSGIGGFYRSMGAVEPGYVLLMYLVEQTFHSFEALFACSSFIALFFFYRAFSYHINKMSLGLCVFVFASTQYFYYFGIDRLFLAVSIVAFAYRYVLSGKHRTYCAYVALASSFHYSALFMIFLPICFTHKSASVSVRTRGQVESRESAAAGTPSVRAGTPSVRAGTPSVRAGNRALRLNWYYIFGFCVVLPGLFFWFKGLILLLPDKYLGYAESGDVASVIGSVLLKIPILFLFWIFSKNLFRDNADNKLYLLLFSVSLVVQLCTLIVPIGRLNWYMWTSICFLFPALVSSFSGRPFLWRGLVAILLVCFCVSYSFRAYFFTDDDSRVNVLLPYSNVFFDLQ